MLPDRRLFANGAGLRKFALRLNSPPIKLKVEYVSFMCLYGAAALPGAGRLTMNSVAREKFRS
jgi:hypothetical protein